MQFVGNIKVEGRRMIGILDLTCVN
jgi:hypothetical protein